MKIVDDAYMANRTCFVYVIHVQYIYKVVNIDDNFFSDQLSIIILHDETTINVKL